MSHATMDYVTIRCRIDGLSKNDGTWHELSYRIGEHQVRELRVGRPPPFENYWAVHDWQERMERADKLAKYIGGEIAHNLIKAFNPE